MRKVTLAALALLAMASCTKTDSEMDLALDNEVRIISSISSRASGDSWAENDEIGVYMNLTGGVLGALGSNKVHITKDGDGNFTATPPLYFPTSGKVDLLAYYPHNSAVGFDPTEYAVNVTSQTSLPAIDLMLATATGLDKSSKSVELTFAHKLSNIVITIENGDGFTTADLQKVSVSLTGTKAVASYDLTEVDNPIITFDTETKASSISITPTSNGTRAEAIVIPQALSGATLEFKFTGDDNVYSAPIATEAYLAGNTYSYTAEIKKTGVTLSAANITQWVKGNGDNGEDLTAEKVVPDMEYKDGTFEIYTDKGLKAFADLVNGVVNDTAKVTWGDSELSFTTTCKPLIDGKLMDDIDLSEICGEEIGEDKEKISWTPIANTATTTIAYQGTFDGNGKVVTGLYINTPGSYNQGLFGYIYTGAKIVNIGVEGEILASRNIGGVVGSAYGAYIAGCYSNVSVTGVAINSYNYTGGIVGYLFKSTLIASYNLGSVTGQDCTSGRFGGVVGSASNSKIMACYNTAGIYSSNSNSYYFGGVVGEGSNCSMYNCYWVDVTDAATNGDAKNDSNINMTKCADITTLNNNIAELNEAIALWNFGNKDNLIEVQFTEVDSQTPPALTSGTPTISVDGISYVSGDDCYNISNANGLSVFAKLVNMGSTTINGKLTTGISLKSVCGNGNDGSATANWTPIGNEISKYSGVFNGNNQTISDLYIDNNTYGAECQALFGYVSSATIENLTLSGSVKGYEYTGGIIGYAYGVSDNDRSTIRSCVNNATVYGGYGGECGGVVAHATYADIISCENNGEVTGDDRVGGVVGYLSYATITSCENSQTINAGGYYGGGIVGYSIAATITNCNNSGAVICSTSDYNYGGVVGYLKHSDVVACSNSADLSYKNSAQYIGGVVGTVENTSGNNSSIVGCYNSGTVSGYSRIGGVVGYISGSGQAYVTGCYNSATVSTNNVSTISAGGVIGEINSNTEEYISGNYWYDASDSDKAVNGIGSIDGSASDTGAEKLSTIAALNGKVDALNNAIYTWNESNSAACPYKYQAGSGEIAPSLVAGEPTYTDLQ